MRRDAQSFIRQMRSGVCAGHVPGEGFVFIKPRELHEGETLMMGEVARGAVGVPVHPRDVQLELQDTRVLPPHPVANHCHAKTGSGLLVPVQDKRNTAA